MPQQALALANSSLCLEQARLLAGKLEKELPPRPLESHEQSVCDRRIRASSGPIADPRGNNRVRRLSRRTARSSSPTYRAWRAFSSGPPLGCPRNRPGQRAREDLVHVLFNHNDFVTIR